MPSLSELAGIAGSVDDHGRLLSTDSPAVRLGLLLGAEPPGEHDRFPVALFEPANAVGMTMPDGSSVEMQVESVVEGGLPRLVYPFACALPTPTGWAVRRTEDQVLELHYDGGVWSRIQVPIEPAWSAAADRLGHVVSMYGCQLGVRTPPGAKRYTGTTRQEELLKARQQGIVAGGLLRWQGGNTR